ncbi:MAG: efflux RND transporter periplasmic adaptor subunit [Verrucomicrobia bacterium]|nr:efflux RND transporter periplasmic adaptor subunit [Verrucomicrobiota bacterium]
MIPTISPNVAVAKSKASIKPPYIRATLIAILFLLVVAGLLFYPQISQLIGFGPTENGETHDLRPIAVTTAVAATCEWQSTLDAIGNVTAINGVTVSTDLAGLVDQIAFTSGTPVKAGQLLAHLNTDQEQAQLEQAEAQLDLALVMLHRNRELLEKRSISQSDYDTSEATYRQDKAQVEQFRALIARKTLRAPFDGVLGIRQANLGQYLNVGDPVVTLQSFDPIYVNFSLPQQNLSELHVGQETSVQLDAYGNDVFTGKINAVNSLVDPATRNILVQAILHNPDGRLRPGMFGQVSVLVSQREEVIALPLSSVHYAPYGDSVFIVSGANAGSDKQFKTVKEQFVKLGGTRGDLTAVTSGIKPGDEVVTSGVFRLKSGSAILVNNRIQPAANTSPTPENS